MRKMIIASLAAMLCLGSPLWADGDPTFAFSEDDPSMNAAIKAARDTLDVFVANTMMDGQSGPQTMLKVAIPTPTTDEVIWIAPFAQTSDDAWIGVLANQPQFIQGANAGDTVKFTSAQIADWAVFGDDGVMFGGYTIREMVASGAVTPDMVPTMSDDPVPAKW